MLLTKLYRFENKSRSLSEPKIYKRNQESKKTRKKEKKLDQEKKKTRKKELDQESIKKTRKRPRKKEKLSFFLNHFLGRVLVFFFS